MNRYFRHFGRFTADYETNQIHSALTTYQAEVGDTILYYRFDREDSEVNDIYDEGSGVGRVYHQAVVLPVLHVTRVEGESENRPEGFYYNDSIHVTAVYDQIRRSGLANLDITHQNYLHDRFIYNNRVFRILNISVVGQIQGRDIMVGIDGTEVKADEMVNDYQFRAFPGVSTPTQMSALTVPWSAPAKWNELE